MTTRWGAEGQAQVSAGDVADPAFETVVFLPRGARVRSCETDEGGDGATSATVSGEQKVLGRRGRPRPLLRHRRPRRGRYVSLEL